jgi:hypothetical protein
MSDFRGQYMDMVHPSSDVGVTDKPNNADKQPIKEPLSTVSSELEQPPIEDQVSETIDTSETDIYESPFLPDVEVEKRPLGGSPAENTKQLFGITDETLNSFDINSFIDLDQPELPADDGGKGELVPELPSGEENQETTTEDQLIESPRPEPHPAVADAIAEPQNNTPLTIEPSSPFAHASDVAHKTPTRKPMPIWLWALIFVLIAAAGVAAGAVIYLIIG